MDVVSDNATAAPKATEPKGLKVGKPFKTHNRRFKPGDAFAAADLADSALDLEHLKKRGFVVAA